MLKQKNIAYKKQRTVRLLVTFKNKNINWGTGFFISEKGLLLTCAHVMAGMDFKLLQKEISYTRASGSPKEKVLAHYFQVAAALQIQLEDGAMKEVTVEKIDPEFDIALLKVCDDTDGPFPFFTIDSKNEPFLGEEISFYGFPNVLGYSHLDSPFVVNQSIISTFADTIIAGAKYPHMQINATTLGGISGAPVFKGDSNMVMGIINGNFHWTFENIVRREQNKDEVYSTKVPLGIGYATSLRLIREKTEVLEGI